MRYDYSWTRMRDGKIYYHQEHANGQVTLWRWPRIVRGKALRKAVKRWRHRND